MEYLTTVEMSEKWNITSRRWLIPADATKPADARRKNIKGANDGK